MATYYWIGTGGGTWDNSTTTNWSASSGGGGGAGVPGSADTAIFDSNSGSNTITTVANISITSMALSTGFTGTVTFGSGYTFTTSSQIIHAQGTLNTNGQTCSWGNYNVGGTSSRTLTLGSSSITITGSGAYWIATGTISNLTVTPNTATVTNNLNNATFRGLYNWNGLSVVISAGDSGFDEPGSITLNNVTFTGSNIKSSWFYVSSTLTVTGTLTANGNSTVNRVLIAPLSMVSNVTINAAAVSLSNVDFRNVTAVGAANWNISSITGGAGDCGGNSGMTLTTPATQTWAGTSSGNWSTNAWTSRVPLPQDPVVISSAFVASQTITVDMPRMGNSINFTGTTGSPTVNLSTYSALFGSLTLVSGISVTGNSTLYFMGQGSNTITQNGATISCPINIDCQGTSNSYSLGGDLTTTSTMYFQSGTFNANGSNVSVSVLSSASNGYFSNLEGLTARVINMGSGTWTLPSTGSILSFATITSLTLNADTSTIAVTDISSSSKTLNGGGLTYNILTITPGGTGAIVFAGANTFNEINCIGGAATLTFTHAITQNIIGSFNVSGVAGSPVTINSDSSGNAAILNCTQLGVVMSCNYLSIQDSNPAQLNTWYAGANSTAISNTGYWMLSAPPAYPYHQLAISGVGS